MIIINITLKMKNKFNYEYLNIHNILIEFLGETQNKEGRLKILYNKISPEIRACKCLKILINIFAKKNKMLHFRNKTYTTVFMRPKFTSVRNVIKAQKVILWII